MYECLQKFTGIHNRLESGNTTQIINLIFINMNNMPHILIRRLFPVYEEMLWDHFDFT